MLEAYFWSTRVKCADRLISSDMIRGLLMHAHILRKYNKRVPVTPLFIVVGFTVIISFDSRNFLELKLLFEPKCKEVDFCWSEKVFSGRGHSLESLL